nr:ATP synthase F1 subunit epsilon [uncultured Bacteroides sp.]
MVKKLYLDMVSPEREIFKGEVESVTLPGTAGSFTILPQHAPIVSSLQAGVLTYVTKDEEHTQNIKGGFIEMSGETVSVCVENE